MRDNNRQSELPPLPPKLSTHKPLALLRWLSNAKQNSRTQSERNGARTAHRDCPAPTFPPPIANRKYRHLNFPRPIANRNIDASLSSPCPAAIALVFHSQRAQLSPQAKQTKRNHPCVNIKNVKLFHRRSTPTPATKSYHISRKTQTTTTHTTAILQSWLTTTITPHRFRPPPPRLQSNPNRCPRRTNNPKTPRSH